MTAPDEQPPGKSPDEDLDPKFLPPPDLLNIDPNDDPKGDQIQKALMHMKETVTPPEVLKLENPKCPKNVLNILRGEDEAAAMSLIGDLKKSGMIPSDWPKPRLWCRPGRDMGGIDFATTVLLTAIRSSKLDGNIALLPDSYREVQDGIWILPKGSVLTWNHKGRGLDLCQGPVADRFTSVVRSMRNPTKVLYVSLDSMAMDAQMGGLAFFLLEKDSHSDDPIEIAGDRNTVLLAARAARIYQNTLLLASPLYDYADCVMICTGEDDSGKASDVHINARVIGTPEELDDREGLIQLIAKELNIDPNKGRVTLLTDRNPSFGPCVLFPAWEDMSSVDAFLTPTADARAAQWSELSRRIEEGLIVEGRENGPGKP